MKNILRTAILAAAFFTAAAGTTQAQNQDGTLVYNRRLNRSIGITPIANAIGASYNVVDANGNSVLSGRINGGGTFYLPTSKLKTGAYHFMIGGSNAQSFIIK